MFKARMFKGKKATPHGSFIVLALQLVSVGPRCSQRRGTAPQRRRLRLSAPGVPRRKLCPQQNTVGEDGPRRTARSGVLFLRREGGKSGGRCLPACPIHR